MPPSTDGLAPDAQFKTGDAELVASAMRRHAREAESQVLEKAGEHLLADASHVT